MITGTGNIIGSPAYTKTKSALFASNTTDVLAVDDTIVELLSLISNLPDNVVSIFVQNASTENLQLFIESTSTGFVNGATIQSLDGVTVEPLGNNVYLKSTATGTNVVAIIQYSVVAFPPVQTN